MDEVRRKQLIGVVMPKTQNERKGKGKKMQIIWATHCHLTI
jgi:hypothetical protein